MNQPDFNGIINSYKYTSKKNMILQYLLSNYQLQDTSLGVVTLKIMLNSASLGLSFCKYCNQLCKASVTALFVMQIPRTIPSIKFRCKRDGRALKIN